jgi:hypothetical protein
MYKEKLIEIIPKAKKVISPVEGYLFWFSVVLIIVLIGLFFFLQNQIFVLGQKKINLEKSLTTMEEEEALNKEINLTAGRIGIFSKILKEHRKTSKFLNFLRVYCHSKVQILSLDLDARVLNATFNGKTDDFQTLGEQILILKESGFVSNIQVSKIFLDRKGKVGFSLSFNFSENIIKF